MSIDGAIRKYGEPRVLPEPRPMNPERAVVEEEDECTQANTQKEYDPRRLGLNNSGIEEEDIADVLCILHPCSLSACRIVARTLLRAPQHVLQNAAFDDFDKGKSLTDMEEQETFIFQGNTPQQALDLALRFSSRTVHPTMGFLFGRKSSACDVVFDTDSVKGVSNIHFRIYLNETGTCMLQDMSTNGTLVDEVHLKGRRGNGPQTRMLTSGSVIQILSGKTEQAIKFIVRFPGREGHEAQYQARCLAYLEGIALAEARTLAHLQPPARQHTQAVVNHGAAPRRADPATSVAPLVIQQNPWGMSWNGGSKYNVVGHLGKGAFATVYRLATKSTGEYFAAKELDKRRFVKNGVLDRRLENELQIMKSTNHANIVRYIGYCDHEQHLYIIMEYIPCGDLQHHLHAMDALPESTALAMSSQILDALAYLHAKNVTHRDIKPDNILLANNDISNFQVKLSDFGLSKAIKSERTFLTTFCGTLLYCAPEVFPHHRSVFPTKAKKRDRPGGPPPQGRLGSYSDLVDIWSYGCVLWYALCKQPPFEGVLDSTGKGMFERIMTTELDPTPLFKRGVSEVCVDLVLWMIEIDPSQRPSAFECLYHPWLAPSHVVQQAANKHDRHLGAIAEEGEVAPKMSEPDLSQLRIDGEDSGDFDGEVSIRSSDFEYMDARESKRVKFDGSTDGRHNGNPARHLQASALLGSSDTRPANNYLGGEETRLSSRLPESPVLPSAGERSSGYVEEAEQFRFAVADLDETESSGANDRDPHTVDRAARSESLMGAESLVRELNMDTSEDGVSATADENEPNTLGSVNDRDDGSRNDGTAQGTPTHPHEETPKPKVFKRQIDLPLSASFFYEPKDPSTHNAEYASLRSGHDFFASATVSASQLRTLSTNTSTVVSHTVAKSICGLPALQPAPDFVKPPPRLGRLVSTRDSFADIIIPLSSIETTFGRGPNNTLAWHDVQDSRIPRRAFTIMFHAAGIKQAKKAGKDWTKLDGLHCVIATDAKFGILVNGSKLMPKDDKGRALYGKVYNGDTITVWTGESGSLGTRGTGLAFTCEFLQGESKTPRSKANQTFRIQHD